MALDYLSTDELLQLLKRLDQADTTSTNGERLPIDNGDTAAPRPRIDRPRTHARPIKPGDLTPLAPREDPMKIIREFGVDRVRRTVRTLSMPAAIPEVRRAVSSVAAKFNVSIHPNIADGNRLVDEVCNWSPSKLAVELIRVMKADRLPDAIEFHREISRAGRYLSTLQDLLAKSTAVHR